MIIGRARTALITVLLCCMSVAVAWADLPSQDWTRTETRADCASYNPLRTPLFGETHIHTSFSGDATFVRVRTTPRDAYMFAKGAQIGLPPYDASDLPTRFAQLRRPLDFTAVTDHAEWLGEIRTCLNSGLPGYDDSNCQALRDELASPPAGINAPLPLVVVAFQLTIQSANPMRLSICDSNTMNCQTQASLVWQDELDAAEEFYDRTAACGFTTFPAYEWTNNLGGYNLHRNIIFRNADVQPLPTSYYEEPHLEGLFTKLEDECLNAGGSCDFLSIPHNSNASGGSMFKPVNSDGSALTKAGAARRASHEPLVEIFQHKGSSECDPASSPNDELCGFEQLHRPQLFGTANKSAAVLPLSFVRQALREGLRQHDVLGVNPFELGLIGSTDTHNSTPGSTVEEDYAANGHLGLRDAIPENILSRIGPGGVVTNAGGLAVVYAEENSRDAIFAAMRRRETYATSGTRPIVRFFGGRPAVDACNDPNFVEEGYTRGVPMGGEIGPVLARRSPRFAVMAQQDPGGNGEPSTPLQRIQIVKGWVDENHKSHEKVFDVAGNALNGAGVDLATCTPTGTGSASLCATWKDPAFRPNQRAFYYARVLENPVCRWSTRLCNSLGVDCSNPGSVPSQYAECCSGLVDQTVQERAWTSPIFYQPERLGVKKGWLKFGAGTGDDKLHLELMIGRVPPELDIKTNGLTLTLRDDDVVYSATLPAGALVETVPGRAYRLNDPSGAFAGIKKARVRISKRGTAKMTFDTIAIDLSHAEQSSHRVSVQLASGGYDQTDARSWNSTPERLDAEL